MATRWAAMLDVLGVTEHEFELDKARFDGSPREWVKARIVALVGEPGDLTPETIFEKCSRPCCEES